jgi:hypothetical protein
MRTTLDIDDDLMRTAKELAQRQGVSAGKVVSRLMRSALLAPNSGADAESASGKSAAKLGFRPLQGGSELVTNDDVNRLREVEGI